jgi:pimeloyl-ACP methyl ester carboxylesterase
MAYANSGGVKIYYEDTGGGVPILFVHEFAGDHRSWEAQVRHFSRSHRCLSMSARGYPPSDVPDKESDYGQDQFNRDAVAVLDAAKVEKAHVVGLSMGGYAVLMVGAKYPGRVLSAVAAGAGSGADAASRKQFEEDALALSKQLDKAGKLDAETMGLSPTRVQLQVANPRGWKEFVAHLSEHSAKGSARTLRNVQIKRPTLYRCESDLKRITAPVLLMVGDEDEPCLDVNLWMKRLMPNAELAMLPRSGHAINLEDPALFNLLLERFIVNVDRGTWRPRDPRALKTGVFASSLKPS